MGRWQETIGEGFGTGKHAGTERKHPVTDQRDGTIGGYHTEKWDGSQDATVKIKPVAVRAKTQGDEDA
jgi:hypothetical protein